MTRGSRGRAERTVYGGPRRGYAQSAAWMFRDCPNCHARKGFKCGKWYQATGRHPKYDEPTWETRDRPHRER